ncbi:DUF4388 domain-containing protein [Deinococcus sp.]|uniref:DUF4388 domain-containing protein n=1 Tax=Deinococcus sp. TaxID=47478 RepID=UPI0025F1AC0F|nr:DUF4388 domain-containing protein [Deinococcus sp.]
MNSGRRRTPSALTAQNLPRLVVVSEVAQPLVEALIRHLSVLADWTVQAHSRVSGLLEAAAEDGPNLVILELGAQLGDAVALLEHAKLAWPTTAFLLFTVTDEPDVSGLIERFGLMTVLHQPSVRTLCQTVEREMSGLSFGLLRGLSLPSMLQMLHWDKKSVSVLVSCQSGVSQSGAGQSSAGQFGAGQSSSGPAGTGAPDAAHSTWGRLHLSDGELFDAYVHRSRATGEAAALEILSWEEVTLFLERSYHNHRRVVVRPLAHLLMAAMQQKDEEVRMRDDLDTLDLILDDDDPEDEMFFRRKPTALPAQLSGALELLPQPVPAAVLDATVPEATVPEAVTPEATVPDAATPSRPRKPAGKKSPPPSPDPLVAIDFPAPEAAEPVSSPELRAPPAPPSPSALSGERLPVTAPPSLPPTVHTLSEVTMANVKTTLDSLLNDIDGSMAVALVDFQSGMALGTAGTGINLDVAAAGNTEVVRAKMRVMDSLGIKGQIEDILITLETQYHIIYLVPNQSLFLYLVLARDRANLAMARYKLKAIGNDLKI